MHAAEFLKALTIVLLASALMTVVFQRLRQPVVLGYVLAGLFIGPHVPFPLVADPAIVHTLSELGVILLMFALGLEFSLRELFRVAPTAGVTALVQCSVMVWLGFVVGRAFGWTTQESLFVGAIIAISSTTIIAKAFDEEGVRGKLRELVVGILIAEDLLAIVLMATLTAVASGAGLSPSALVVTLGKLVGFLVVLVGVGLLVVPRVMRFVVRLGRDETIVVSSIGICFGISLLAHAFGYSVALGAFIAGSLVAESGEAKRVEHLIMPVRDVFAAIFFVSVGMLIDPALVAQHWLAIVVLTIVVIAGKLISVSLGAFMTGNGTRLSVAAGMSLAQIGEFSFIIAGLGVTLGATGAFLYPVAVAVSAITTLTTPWLIRGAGPFAAFVDRKLPHALQTFATLYASWFDRLRQTPARSGLGARVRRHALVLLIDAVILAGVVIGVAVNLPRLAAFGEARLNVTPEVALWVVMGAATLLCVPFALGVFRVARQLGVELAAAALPAATGGMDRAAAPRRTLVVSLQLGCAFLVAAPIAALTQPFVPDGWGALALVLVVLVLGLAFWRSATQLDGHVRAGSELILEVLAKQVAPTPTSTRPAELAQVHELLPGIGEPQAVLLEATSAAVGRTLAQLNLRGVTGATVLAITRDDGSALVPGPEDVLRRGDVLALAGSAEAVHAARELLGGVARDLPSRSA